MVDVFAATTPADFSILRGLLDEMAAWDAVETGARGYDTAALIDEGYSASAEELRAHFTSPGAMMFLATHAGQVAGCGGFSPAGAGLAEVEKIYVAPAFRGLGVGRALVDAVITGMSTAGYQAARLETATFMTAAITLYRGFGFTEVPAFRRSLGNLGSLSVFMQCRLDARPL